MTTQGREHNGFNYFAASTFDWLSGGKFVRLAAFLCLIVISFSAPAFSSDIKSIEPDESTLTLKGEINKNLFDYYKSKISKKIKKVVVTSLGGDIKYGIYIGNDIFDRKLDVIVRDYCLSSCANYIFLAGKNKIIENNSIVGFHGTSFSLLGGEEIKKIILNSKGDFIKTKDILQIKNHKKYNNEIYKDNISDLEFFERVAARKNILFDFSGTIHIEEDKYENKPPYDDIAIWPSSELLKKCYHIKNVDDRFRPKNEFGLVKDWQVRHPNARLFIGGDNMFDGCKKRLSQAQITRSCTATKTNGIDDKGIPTTVETTVCR